MSTIPTTLVVENLPSSNIKAKTALAVDVAAGVTSITAESVVDLLTDDFIVLGAPGDELTEAVKVSSVDTTTQIITLATATLFAHRRAAPIRSVWGNQIKIYRASNVDGSIPGDASFSVITTLSLDLGEVSTTYTDTNGGPDYWYKSSYYQSVLLQETSLALSTAMRGGGYGEYCTLDEIRDEGGFKGAQYVSDGLVDSKRIDAQTYIDSMLSKVATVPFTTVPPLVRLITKYLATGYLMIKEYGPPSETNIKGIWGQKKIDFAEKKLQSIIAGDIPLIDAAGNDLTTEEGFSSYPDDDTLNSDGLAAPEFSMTKHF